MTKSTMNARRLTALLMCGSALAGFGATAAYAQAASSDVETVVVTGTSIRGAAPVGANVISVDRDSIEATGATTVQSLLTSVPAVTGFGNAGQGGYGSFDGSGSNAPTIHSLGASASNSTLILVDSHRIPVSGLSHTLADPSTIPQIALQRVEVLPTGASSVYGSDAVAGVLNFITRKNYTGAETDLEYGAGLDYNSFNFGQIIGTAWDKGSVMAAYNFISRSRLEPSSRTFVTENQSARAGSPGFGLAGANFGNFNCSPATITIGSTNYSYPYSAASTATNPCGQTADASLLPADTRNAAFVSITDQVADWLTISSDLNWSNRVDNANTSRGTVTATVFGPGSGKGTQINPFFVAPAGTAATSETVKYDFNGLFGPGGHTKSGTEVVYGTVDFDVKLPDGWSATLDSMFGASNANSRTRGTVCTACAYLALNGTTNANGDPTKSSNPTVLTTTTLTTRPLTTGTALNVWGAAGSTAAGGANTGTPVLNQLLDNDNYSQTTQTMNDVNLDINGTLFSLPAGDVKVAFGGEYRNQALTQYSVSNGSGGASITNSSIFDASFGRSVYAAFVEFKIPVISAEAGIPLVQSLDFDVSGRYDKYSDFGDTKNPHVALDWGIVDGLKARASYGTSFVAPALTSTGGAAGRTIESAVSYGNTVGGQVTVPATYTNFGTGKVGTVDCSNGCSVGSSSAQGIVVAGPGGPSVQPETSMDYTLGMDWNAGKMWNALNGLTVSVTYWQTTYKGAITSPIAPLDVQIPGLNKNLIINPTAAQIDAAYDGTRRINSTPSGAVDFIQFYVQQNAFNLWANGLDYEINYAFSTDTWGDFLVGLDVSQKLRFTQQNGGAGGGLVNNLNVAGVNTTFSSLATTGRLNFGWHMDPIKVDIGVNYTGAYHQYFSNKPYKISSNTTVDATVAYDLPNFNPWASGTELYVTANNLFNQPPPAYIAAVGYDTADASPIDRLIMFGIKKKW